MENHAFTIAAAAAALGVIFYFFLRRGNAGAVPPAEGSAFGKYGLNVRLRDLFRLSVMLEEKGRNFYRTMEMKVSGPEARKLCAWLAEEEEKHRQFAQSQLDKWRPLSPHLTEWPAFLEKVRQEGFFADPPGDKASERELAAFAIRQEIKSAEFYALFKEAFPEAWKRSRLEKLVMEERSHEARLRAVYPDLK